MRETDSSGHLTIISSDAHAGADLLDYQPYLAHEWRDDFDRWVGDFVNPFESEHLLTNDPSCNWDSELRTSLLESQGVVAEVLFPNTVPPFYPQTQFFVPPPPQSRAEYDRRWAGLQAHNRWLVDFCDELPGRRAGIAHPRACGRRLARDLVDRVAVDRTEDMPRETGVLESALRKDESLAREIRDDERRGRDRRRCTLRDGCQPLRCADCKSRACEQEDHAHNCKARQATGYPQSHSPRIGRNRLGLKPHHE
jgi:hypothetical protein